MTTPEQRSSSILLSAALEAAQQGYASDSDKLFAKAINLSEKAQGRNCADYAKMLVRYADICSDKGRTEKAEALYREALEIYEKTCGFEHISAGLLMRNLSEICHRLGKKADASDWRSKSLRILSNHANSRNS